MRRGDGVTRGDRWSRGRSRSRWRRTGEGGRREERIVSDYSLSRKPVAGSRGLSKIVTRLSSPLLSSPLPCSRLLFSPYLSVSLVTSPVLSSPLLSSPLLFSHFLFSSLLFSPLLFSPLLSYSLLSLLSFPLLSLVNVSCRLIGLSSVGGRTEAFRVSGSARTDVRECVFLNVLVRSCVCRTLQPHMWVSSLYFSVLTLVSC